MDGPWTQYATAVAPQGVPAGPWTQYALQTQDDAPAALPTSAGSVDEYGRTQSSDAAVQPSGPVARIAEAGAKGAAEGFGNPVGQTILTPQAQDWMDAKQREGGAGGFLAKLGSTAAEDIGTVGGVLAGIPNAAFRGAQGVVAQTGAELGAPQLGRDIAAVPEAFMGAPEMLRAPGAAPTITAREVQARDGVGMMEGWQRAHAENTTASAQAVANIGAATDIDGAIAAAGKAAGMPTGAAAAVPAFDLTQDIMNPPGSRPEPAASPGQGDLFTQPEAPIPTVTVTAPITTAQIQARDGVGYNEAVRRAEAENAAAIDAAAPASAGAAASREGTAAALINEVTPAQKATALQKMVNQSAEDRLTPQGRDDAVYVPGVERPEAMRDFSPTPPEGGMSSALTHKALYNDADTRYHDQFDAQVKKNNNLMVDDLGGMIGDANTRDAAMDTAKGLMPGSVGLFKDQIEVSAQPIVDEIKDILASPAGKQDAVISTLNTILPKLYEGNDVNGKLETLPSMLKGVRDDITNKLYNKLPTTEGDAARTSRNQLRAVLAVVDRVIGEGLPGTKYQDYLSNLSAALGQVSKLDYLQKFLTGPRKLTNGSGDLQLIKVQKLLEDIQLHHADQTGGAKELTMDEINRIEAVRNELATKDLLDKRAGVRNSSTAQLTNAAGFLGTGPLGTAVRGGAEMALHGGLALTTHGVGNAALIGYRHFVKPQIDAARATRDAAELELKKARLLDTTPRLEVNPQPLALAPPP